MRHKRNKVYIGHNWAPIQDRQDMSGPRSDGKKQMEQQKQVCLSSSSSVANIDAHVEATEKVFVSIPQTLQGLPNRLLWQKGGRDVPKQL